MAGLQTVLADVHRGTRTDAFKFSLASNHSHGLRRTNEDKQFAVTLALREFAHLSDRLIAEMCGVSHPIVGPLRRQLVKFTSSEERAGKDGRLRRLPITSPTKSRVQAFEAMPSNGLIDPEPDFKQGVYTAIVGDNSDLVAEVAKLYLCTSRSTSWP